MVHVYIPRGRTRLTKKMGLKVESTKNEAGERKYRIAK